MIMIMIMIMIIIILIIQRVSHSSSVIEYEEEMGLQLQLEYPNPTCIKHDSGEVITAEKLKAELRRCLEQKTICARSEGETLNFEGRFWCLSGWKQCPTHTVAEFFEL